MHMIDADRLIMEIERRIEFYQTSKADLYGINTALMMAFVELKGCVENSKVNN